MSVQILIGDCRVRLQELPDASVDSVVCDPPYHLTAVQTPLALKTNLTRKDLGPNKRRTGFMGQTWDGGDVAFQPETWAEVLRVLKPGGHLIAFSGTRTYHRMVCAIEDAGFEIRDQLAWVYGSGFPKSLDVSKQIDKAAGAEREVVGRYQPPNGQAWNLENDIARPEVGAVGHSSRAASLAITAPATDAALEWQGWGTALKPSWEPICLARRPLVGTVAANVLAHRTGALNIDGCRIEAIGGLTSGGSCVGNSALPMNKDAGKAESRERSEEHPLGRWPANLCHDGSEEVLAGFPDANHKTGGQSSKSIGGKGIYGGGKPVVPVGYEDEGTAARFFYCAKASAEDRGEGNNHPTVKPIALMRWLVRLVTPKGGTVLDPFMGSGSTGLAADAEQFNFIGCEMSPEYAAIAERRIRDAAGMFAEVKAA